MNLLSNAIDEVRRLRDPLSGELGRALEDTKLLVARRAPNSYAGCFASWTGSSLT
jgi:hypothetical protein